MHTDNIALCETQYNNAHLDCVKTLILQETLKIQNQHQEDSYAFSEVKHFLPISWMCKKQTSVSHSSTEAEVISLYASLRMDEPAVDLWDLVIEVFHSSPNLINKTKDQKTQGNLSQNTKLHMKKTKSNKAHQSGSGQ